MNIGRSTRCLAILFALPAALFGQAAHFSFDDAQVFLKNHCQMCHTGNTPASGFDIQQISSPATVRTEAQRWSKLVLRVRNGEMPPKGIPAPSADQREQFVSWVTAAQREAACAAGAMPAPARIRRLNRDEYAATIRDLLDIQVDITSSLPVDGAG